MRTILFIVLSLCVAQILQAQQDTLIIKLDDYGQISIMTDQLFNEKGNGLEFEKAYSMFYTDFQKIDKSEMLDNAFRIQYEYYQGYGSHKSNMSIEQNNNIAKIIYFNRKNQQILESFNYTLNIKLSKYNEMEIAVNNIDDFEKIAQISIDSLYKEAQVDVLSRDIYKRIANKIIYSQENEKLNMSNVLVKNSGSQDYINLYPAFGMSVINSNFVPEIDFNIEFLLSKKTIPKYKFGINTSFLFIQDENDFFKLYTYNVANLYYHLFIRDNISHSISLGFMYRKTGPHFNGNTFTASWKFNMKHIGVKLAGYYTKNQEGNYVIIPSIGLNFGF